MQAHHSCGRKANGTQAGIEGQPQGQWQQGSPIRKLEFVPNLLLRAQLSGALADADLFLIDGVTLPLLKAWAGANYGWVGQITGEHV